MKKRFCLLGMLLAVLLAVTPLHTLAEGPEIDPGPLLLYVEWMDAQGQITQAQALPVSYPGYEDCYWVQVPYEMLYSLTLRVTDVYGQFAVLSPGDGTALGLLGDAGTSLDSIPLEITAFGENDMPMQVFRLYVSTMAAQPDDPNGPPRVEPAEVWVYYQTYEGELLNMDMLMLEAGVHDVQANPAMLPADYILDGNTSQQVTVDEYGASPNPVVFYCVLEETPIQPVNVTVLYQDEYGQNVADSEMIALEAGQHTLYANPQNLWENYVLAGADAQQVTVNENGAFPNPVIFTYVYQAPAVPAADVTVLYQDEAGNNVADPETMTLEAGTHEIFPNPQNLLPRYQLTGAASQWVTVDENGASPNPVIFTYAYAAPQADVWVYYQTRDGQFVADTVMLRLEEGEQEVYAQPQNLQPGYVLDSEEPVRVTVNADGTASPNPVVFFYTLPVEPVQVEVRYENIDGMSVASSQTVTLEEGMHDIFAQPADLLENYFLISDGVVQVTVNAYGASVNPVIFYYEYREPAPVTGMLEVSLRDIYTGETLIVYEVEVTLNAWNTISADLSLLPSDYVLMDDMQKEVYVDGDLTATPEAVFYAAQNEPATDAPTEAPTNPPTDAPTEAPTNPPTDAPTEAPTNPPTDAPTDVPTNPPTDAPTDAPTEPPVLSLYLPILYLNEETGLPVAMEGLAECPYGQTTVVVPAPEYLLAGYELTGDTEIAVTVDAAGNADRTEIVFYYHSVDPTQPPMTEEPPAPPVIEPQDVTLWYMTMDNRQVATPTLFTCQPGENRVYPAPYDLEEGCVLLGDGYQIVTLDENGLSQIDVIFYYEHTEAAPTVSPALVRVCYLLRDGTPIADEQNLLIGPGDVPVAAAPVNLPEGYVLDGPESQIVHVDEDGANPSTVTFYYRSSVAAPQVALVPVQYFRPGGETVFYNYTETCIQGMENTIRLDWALVQEYGGQDYICLSDESVSVTVLDDGTASPNEVRFYFDYAPAETEIPPTDAPVVTEPVKVTVFYNGEMGLTVASSQEIDCYFGNNIIKAAPTDLLPGYVLSGSDTQNVVLHENGVLEPSIVIFNYIYIPTPSPIPPTPSPIPIEYTAMDGWCYPKNNGMNFRSGPSTSDGVIRTLQNDELCHIFGQTRNSKGEDWYLVDVEGQQGFLRATLVRVLSEDEVAELFHYTPAPTIPATPVPSPIPDGVPIDRWAYTNTKVNFRKEPEAKSSTLIRELSKNTQVWVYSSRTVDGEQWYTVMVNGREGYLMAEFVDLCSQEESDAIQSQLASPMPTTPPTPAPATDTPAPTATPTLEPTPEVTASPTPDPYKGYALTRWQVALRTGVSDDTILEWLVVDQLVYVSGQTYVNGEAWSSVQAMRSGSRGFVPDNALQRITNEQARPYLDLLNPPAATSTPEPEQQYGFAMTLGDGVPFRAFPDEVGEMYRALPYSTVVNVMGQVYTGDIVWHVVQYDGLWGYVRQDQLRMLSADETAAYLQSLENELLPTATPGFTPEPVTENSLSSYGHVLSNSGKVNLRSEPSTASQRLRLLDNYAFALVMGTVQNDEGLWYHVSQAGTVGYIHGDYFKVLSISELTDFLQSSEYRNANNTGSSTSGQIQSVEDYNQGVWQNPALTASYEPFNPYGTATPDPERLPSPTPTPTSTPLPTSTPAIGLVGPGDLSTLEPEMTQSGGSVWPWVLVIALAAVGGGAYYGYTIHRKNERKRQAARAQQARQNRAGAQQPQMRSAPNNPQTPGQGTRPYSGGQNNGNYMPPRQGTSPQRPASGAPDAQNRGGNGASVPQGTRSYSPTQNQNGGVPGGTRPYQPIQNPQRPAAPVTPAQNATPVQPAAPVQNAAPVPPVQPAAPVQNVAPVPPVQPAAPVQNAAPVPPVQPAAPVQNAALVPPVQPVSPAQSTGLARPLSASQQPEAPAQGGNLARPLGASRQPEAPVQGGNLARPLGFSHQDEVPVQTANEKAPAQQPADPAEGTEGARKRQRRADRHRGADDGSGQA